ncbi:receptor L domain-containing protein [Kordia periserrulae]|uniref:Receptor L domain-containing protein n=1 Tax=Kordia periserrulae TaxID=701523 RepID=A0A2T6C1K7_9FLAO|nr:leucine-rich repeat domain-containing protein [Kordia periserrulae]PTX62189.1 receptor L domain-containing protein [Kordia periserrulae]
MKKLLKLTIAFVCVLSLQNCENDDLDTRTIPNLQTQEDILRDEEFIAENFGNFTTGDFSGIIEDNNGTKLNNVQVTIGNVTVFTNRDGIFLIKSADVYENFAYIKAKKEGYLDASRVVIPKVGGENRVLITMLKKNIVATVNSGEFSTVALDNGVKVNFSGGFVREDGTTYTGQVDVMLDYLGPNSADTFRRMPGSLFAQDSNNDARTLETYGMISVNLFSPSGEPLNINQFNRATIEIPIDFSNTNNAPDFIPLWYFDEERGYWKEEGQAVRFSNMYVAEVSHFTWWNCDIPYDLINLCFSITDANTNLAVPYQTIIRLASNEQFIYYGYVTANQAVECGWIPMNEEIEVKIYESSGICSGQLVHSQTLGGFATNTNVDISFTNDNLTSTDITGMATDCNGNPITNGYVYIDDLNTYFIADGTISISLTNCDTMTVNIQIFDFDSNQWTFLENVALDGTTVNLGTVSTCEDTGGTFNGNIVLATQEEVNDFGGFGFTQINGNVTIGNLNNFTNITDLSPLATITSITGYLRIAGNENLTTLQDLQNISNVDGYEVLISNNPSLTSLAGFSSLASIKSLKIDNNDGLTSLAGIPSNLTVEQGLRIMNNANLTSLQGIDILQLGAENDLRISNNDVLTSLSGVENITQLRFLTIDDNDALNSLTAFQNLTQVLDLTINNNDALVTLVGLESLLELRILIVANNENLQNLNGLDNLTTFTPSIFNAVNIGAIQWENFCTGYINGPNPSLTDYCAIETFMNSYQWDNSGASLCAVIVGNAYNPTVQDFIDGNCSQ